MKKIMRMLQAALLVVVGLITQSPALAGDTHGERQTLKGIKTVQVLVENLEPEVEAKGLTKDIIQTDVEVRLRQAGISVADTVQPTFLYIYVHIMLRDDGSAVYSASVSFCQNINLVRDPRIFLAGVSTWDVRDIGIVGVINLRQVREAIKDYTDKFINAYLSVNPK